MNSFMKNLYKPPAAAAPLPSRPLYVIDRGAASAKSPVAVIPAVVKHVDEPPEEAAPSQKATTSSAAKKPKEAASGKVRCVSMIKSTACFPQRKGLKRPKESEGESGSKRAKKSRKFEPQSSTVKFCDFGGNEEALKVAQSSEFYIIKRFNQLL